ncbi:type III pantothenate kinase [Steroidobacter denitrificans]|uniref:Type III pantothenate kinase n=1 Tax=Steroidobacter denitrificans TaxID=465721 RepID=A0A127F6S6_STEDE|nr:type III pantothenate kinase [Steroidobacter denitrificans]AMN46156.1 type III pantothenate kinase [Steroidobacter denitrificans]
MILLVDIGNTRIKWAYLDKGELGEQGALMHAAWTPEAFIAAISAGDGQPDRVLAGNVGGNGIGERLCSVVRQAWSIDTEFVQASAGAGGVTSGYADPAQLGVDRWLAIIGAHAMAPGASCIVDVGTAMTIDGVTAEGRHLGGVIVPGPYLMVDSLHQNTSDLAQRYRQGQAIGSLFADNTRGAIEQGAMHALAALIERSVGVMERMIGRPPILLLTGGGCGPLAGLLDRPHRIVADLVLRGLAVLAQESAPLARSDDSAQD